MGIFDFLKQNKQINADIEPDLPHPFGYKCGWYAIKGETPESVIRKLDLKVISKSNWKFGFDYFLDRKKSLSHRNKIVFVSPVVKDYVLVINIIADNDHNIVKKNALLFENFMYFGTHRVVEYHAWAKFISGKLMRGYSYIGDQGEVSWCEGSLTPDETALSFDRFAKTTEETLGDDFDYDNLPNEEDVMDIAKAWSVDTSFEDGGYKKGVGFICEWK